MVTDAGGMPLEDVLILANPTGDLVYTSSESPPPRPQPSAYEWAYTDANGAYTISGLLTGDYLLEAEATGYLDEYYDGARWQDDATPVFVVEGEETPGINFSLDVGGTITGVVTDAGGNPLGNCDIYADSWDGGGSWGYGNTDTGGMYTVDGLATDDYRVEVECDGYIDEYYDNVRNWDDATPVPVVEGQNTPNIDFGLDLGGTITGAVTDAGGNPLGNSTPAKNSPLTYPPPGREIRSCSLPSSLASERKRQPHGQGVSCSGKAPASSMA